MGFQFLELTWRQDGRLEQNVLVVKYDTVTMTTINGEVEKAVQEEREEEMEGGVTN